MDRGSWHCTEDRDQDHPQEKEMQKSKMAVEEALQIAVKRREAKNKGEKERYTHLNAEFHLEKAMTTHSSTFAWRIPWMEEPGRL